MIGDRTKKSVSDPVHGTIPLNEVEARVMQTQVFQRLRRVKQLGLAHYVYPSADYSRLAHSLGVCHITGLTIQSLARNGFAESEEDYQYYRLAALLHDVGHYPLSHCTEHAVLDYYEERRAEAKLKKKDDGSGPKSHDGEELEGIKHERVSELVLLEDKELRAVLESHGYDPSKIASIFLRQNTADFPLSNLISSDLDADRFDYLLRSSRATGLPYGSIDFEYLLSQLARDEDGKVCIQKKAMRAAEHFLLSRYFDYQQVVFHKAVVGLENITQQVVRSMLDKSLLNYSKATVREAIAQNGFRSGRDVNCWLNWDDDQLMSTILDYYRENQDTVDGLKARCLLERRPPKLVAEIEMIDPRSDGRPFKAFQLNVQTAFNTRANQIGLERDQHFSWYRSVELTSVASRIPATDRSKKFEEEREKSVRIMKQDGRSSDFLFNHRGSLMSTLSDSALYMFRIYVVPKPDQEVAVTELKSQLWADVPDAPWT